MRIKPLLLSTLRRAVRYGAAASLLLTLACVLLWLRSLRALDQLDGRVRFTDFTFTSFGGRLELVFSRAYYLPTNVPDAGQPTLDRLRIDPNWTGGGYASRSRWPIAQTSRAAEARVWFPSPEFETAIVRSGRRRYRGTLRAVVPYWLATPVLAVGPAIAIAAFVRRRRRTRLPFACATCGYDCRESPERCPECGTPRTASVTP